MRAKQVLDIRLARQQTVFVSAYIDARPPHGMRDFFVGQMGGDAHDRAKEIEQVLPARIYHRRVSRRHNSYPYPAVPASRMGRNICEPAIAMPALPPSKRLVKNEGYAKGRRCTSSRKEA